jgi:hypothetical protein
MSAPLVDDALRERLRVLADVLIPAAHGMPAASEVGVAGAQLDRVVAARPDLAVAARAALDWIDLDDVEGSLDRLEAADPGLHHLLLLTIVGGYYIHPDVRARLGYDGQVPVEVRPEIIPAYVEEGLLDGVVGRGQIYRPVPEESEES